MKEKLIICLLLVLSLITLLLFLVLGVLWAGHSIIILPASEFVSYRANFASIGHVALESLPVEVQIRRIFGKDAAVALAVAKAESGLNCDASSKTSDSGLFQINKIHQRRGWTKDQMYNCLENIKMAKLLFDEQGWTPWTSYQTGKYKKFLIKLTNKK